MAADPKKSRQRTRAARARRFFSSFKNGLPSMRITGAGVVEVSARDLLRSNKVKKDFDSATRIVAQNR